MSGPEHITLWWGTKIKWPLKSFSLWGNASQKKHSSAFIIRIKEVAALKQSKNYFPSFYIKVIYLRTFFIIQAFSRNLYVLWALNCWGLRIWIMFRSSPLCSKYIKKVKYFDLSLVALPKHKNLKPFKCNTVKYRLTRCNWSFGDA